MITGAAVATAGYSYAAEAAAAAPDSTAVQEVVVTGSRIPSKNLTSVSPVTTVDNRDIKLQGTTNVEDFLNNLPQVFADQGQYVSNGSVGIATVDLRGLTPKRTLVLIDGKRVQPGDPADPVADINFIPPALIDRVEVLTGGASAVYGSDAVAGVVNFIMKKNFQGLQIDAQTSIGEHENNNQQVRAANTFGMNSIGFGDVHLPSGAAWTGQRHTVTIIGGVNSPDDKGNVEFYAGYSSIDPVLEAKYDWSTCSLTTNNTNATQQYCGGSSTDATGRLTPEAGPNKGKSFNLTGTPVIGTAPPNTGLLILPKHTSALDYNFAPLNYIQRPDTRYTAGFYANYNINPLVNIYSSFMFMDDYSVAQIGPSGSFYGTLYTIPCNDPLLSTAQVNTICGPNPVAGQTESVTIGRRDIEGGGRTDAIEHTDYRIVFGSKGDFGQGWTYDLSMQYGKTSVSHVEGGYFLNSHLMNAVNVIPGPNGTPVCASGGNCVPWNIFTPGGVTQAALDYITGSAQYGGYDTEQVVTGSIANDLSRYGIKSPFATDGAGVSIGGEYRREFLSTSYDAVVQSGDLAGFGGSVKNTRGAQVDKDVFAELKVPLIQDMPFVKELTFETGYRYADYSSGGGNSTYKFALDYQVVPDIRFRGSFERAVRAPNVQELFNPATPGTVGGTDPCGGQTPSYTAAQCYNTFNSHNPTGITEAQFAATIYGNIPQCVSAQCGSYSGGNPDLVPEIADTKSVGVVFTPTFFPGFTMSLDYFNIYVNKAITNLPFQAILSTCALNNNATSCALIYRDPALSYGLIGSESGGTGQPAGTVSTALVNAGALAEKGFDLESNYRVSLPELGKHDWGSMTFHFNGTYINSYLTTLPNGTYDCAGLFGVTCGTPTPKWRHQFRISWNTPWNLQASINWRYIGPTSLDFNTNQPLLQIGAGKDLGGPDAHIAAYSYFDLAFTYKLKDRYTFRAGINNIFDKTPPLLDSNNYGIASPPYGNANTYPQVYDPLGRVLFMGVTADF